MKSLSEEITIDGKGFKYLQIRDVKKFIENLEKWAMRHFCHNCINSFLNRLKELSGKDLR